MENEDELSLPKSVEIDEIIDFYKDKEYPTEQTQTEPTSVKRRRIFDVFKKNKDDNSDIQSHTYGFSQAGRMILYRAISACFCICIILASFMLAYYLPGNEEVIAQQQDELRSQDDYASLKSRYETLKTEVQNLKNSNKDKKKQVEQITDIDNTKAELRTEITAKSYELNELNKAVSEKREIISILDAEIASKSATETTLPPGKYIVGKNIAAGKYIVTGSGKFMQSSSAGKSKVNITLASTPLEVTLATNDIIKFDGKLKFTANN